MLFAKLAGNFYRSEVISDTNSKVDARTSSGAWLNGEKRDANVSSGATCLLALDPCKAACFARI
jgi:hypothetical protein